MSARPSAKKNKSPRCMKYFGPHLTQYSMRKKRLKSMKYSYCGGSYFANYKGCSLYQDNLVFSIVPSEPRRKILTRQLMPFLVLL